MAKRKNIKRVFSLLLTFVMMFTVIPAGIFGVEAVVWEGAEEEKTASSINLDFETDYLYNEAHPLTGSIYYYDGGNAENWSGYLSGGLYDANNRGSSAMLIDEDNGNTAVKFTWDSAYGNENYNANALMNIYNPETKSTFIGTSGKWYTITFKVKVTKNNGGVPLQFYLATSGRTYAKTGGNTAFYGTDGNFNNSGAMATASADDLRVTAAGDTFISTTDGWVTVSANWYADGTHFPLIGVTANNKTKITGLTDYAIVLVDDVEVEEYVEDEGLLFDVNLEQSVHSDFYKVNNPNNWSTTYNGRGSHAEWATEANGNTAIRLTWDADNSNENYNANTAMKIYDPNANARFVGEVGKKYIIRFKYKVENSGDKDLKFYIAPCNRVVLQNPANAQSDLGATDLGPKATVVGQESVFTHAETVNADGQWHTVETAWTGQEAIGGFTVYPLILLEANNKTKDANVTSNYASVLVDNVAVIEEQEEKEPGVVFDGALEQSTHSGFYVAGNPNNWTTSGNGRGAHAEWATEQDGNTAIRLTWDAENGNENYNANNAIKIFNTETSSRFTGETGKRYIIKFNYKVENSGGKTLKFYMAPCNRVAGANPSWVTSDLGATDLGPKATVVGQESVFTPAGTVTADGQWHTIYATWTGQEAIGGYAVYPLIILEANNKTGDANVASNYASVLVDDIAVMEDSKGRIPAYNYNGEGATELEIYRSTTFADLDIPSRKGWIFEGFFTDEALSEKAQDDALVGNYDAIYVKWSGDGNAMTPIAVGKTLNFDSIKSFDACAFTTKTFDYTGVNVLYDIDALGITTTRNTNTAQKIAANVSAWKGDYIFSADSVVENETQAVVLDGILMNAPADSAIFYVELPDFAAADKTYALSLGNRGICMRAGAYTFHWFKAKADGSSKFSFTDGGEWKTANLSAEGTFMGLPSGYKGYIRIDFTELTGDLNLNNDYQLMCIELEPNVLGGECGQLLLGGVVYTPAENSDSTVSRVKNNVDSSKGTYNYMYYDLAPSNEAVITTPYSAYSANASFSTRYTGTVGTPAVKFVNGETSAFWTENPVKIATISGEKEITRGYMTTYINPDCAIKLQPGVDTFMIYVEMPEFEEDTINAPLKLLDTTLTQSGKSVNLMFSNSAYYYADVKDGAWTYARASADGDLKDIPSGFKGFIKFCVKDFKNINDISYYTSQGELVGIDMSKPYEITKFELAFNHIGGENEALTIGGIYSVVVDSDTPFIRHGIKNEKYLFKAIPGDFDANGEITLSEVVELRKQLIGAGSDLEAGAKLRADGNIADLVSATLGRADLSNEATKPDYPNIFSSDIGTNDGAVIYDRVKFDDTDASKYQFIIEGDYDAYREKGDAFAEEVLTNQITTFEKTGIDKMCHVSTFIYSHGNIYCSYYANTISAYENPYFQVARLAYAPESDPTQKTIIDIMQVGDELYGQKVTGVYDTIIMQREDEPDNLYILWTAAINDEYYRLYQVFNMATETLGPVEVNRFKVGNITNDFSREGMKKALTSNGIGYKEFASDIGIMQKLSTRVENGETYYYSGAYCFDFTCIIKSKDLITWEYVAQPNEGANGTGFDNSTKWENAVYVVGDKVYYYVRQWDPVGEMSNGLPTTDMTNRHETGSYYGILTAYDLITGEWDKPILVEDCQSRSDFIEYKGNLYLIYAPRPEYGGTDRCHLGILKVDTNDLSKTKVVLQAQMGTSCFYPYWQYNSNGELCISYTYARQQIRLASIDLSKYLD